MSDQLFGAQSARVPRLKASK